MSQRRMCRYVVPVDDQAHELAVGRWLLFRDSRRSGVYRVTFEIGNWTGELGWRLRP